MSLVTIAIEENPPREAQVLWRTEEVHENSGGIFGAQLQGQYLPEARLHVWSVHIEGGWVTQLKNTGRAPLLRTNMRDYSATMVDKAATFAQGSKNVGLLPRGNSYKLENSWDVGGFIGTLWSIINIFYTGSVTVQENVHVQALGFSKTISQRLRVPVGSVSVRWDAD